MNLIIPHGFEANYTVGFIRGLLAHTIRIGVVSSDETARRLDDLGVEHWNIRGSHDPGRSSGAKLLNLIRYYARLLHLVYQKRGSVVHFTGLLSSRMILFDALVLHPWIRLWSGRHVYTAHNVLPHNREGDRLFRWIYHWVYRVPHVIVVHTRRAARELEEQFGVDPARLRVISIGLNEEIPVTGLTRNEARRRLNLPPDPPLLLFFGKIDRYKGVDQLLQAWSRVPASGARLVIAGWCPDEVYRRELQALIAGCSRPDTLEWREGFVPNEEVESWLAACDGVVMPYRHIYQSGVVFLCLRFGVPIVATDVGSLSEFIDPATGLIAQSNDPDGIAEAISRFLGSKGDFDRGEIARRARQYAWDRVCEPLLSLYEPVVVKEM